MSTVVDSKTAEEWSQEIAALDASINTRSILIGEKRREKQELSFAATKGDAAAIKQVRALATEIEGLIWSNELADDALLVANRKLQEAEKAMQDARIAAILAKRDAVEADGAALRLKIGAALGELMPLVRENDRIGRELYMLSEDAGQERAGNSMQRYTRSTVARFIASELLNSYLGREPAWAELRSTYLRQHEKQELRQMFGVVEPVKLVVGDEAPIVVEEGIEL